MPDLLLNSYRNLDYQFSFELTECISSGHNVIAGTSCRKHRSFTETGLLQTSNLHIQGTHIMEVDFIYSKKRLAKAVKVCLRGITY